MSEAVAMDTCQEWRGPIRQRALHLSQTSSWNGLKVSHGDETSQEGWERAARRTVICNGPPRHTTRKCERCGCAQHGREGKCPALEQKCNKCNARGHFTYVRISERKMNFEPRTDYEVESNETKPFIGEVESDKTKPFVEIDE